MATTCLNCGTELTDKYCHRCGQKATVGRLTWHHLGEEITHFFTHIEHGFIKTTRDLLVRPAVVQKNYIDGKRKIYHKPLSFLLIWVAIYVVVSGMMVKFGYFEKEWSTDTFITDSLEVEAMIYKYQALIEILILPCTAFNIWLWLGYPRMTYLEVLMTGLYRFSVFYMFFLVHHLLGVIFGFNPVSTIAVYVFSAVFTIWSIYVLFSFFRLYFVKYLILRVIAAIAVGLTIYSFVRIMLGKLFLACGF